jgi:hypothetical protein
MTQRSNQNNTNVALGPYGLFTGAWETTNIFLEIAAYVNSSAYLAVSIQQSVDASNVNINTTFNYTPTTEVSIFNTAVGLPYYRIKLENEANVQVAFMSLTTLLVAAPNTPVIVDELVSGNVAITSPLDGNGNVRVDTANLITETLATRRVDFLVVGDYYRVASVGLTSGAEWNQIGAIVDGESVPVIGRLFKCLAIGPAVAGGGTCYDVEYTDTVSATVTNLITETLATRRVDFLVVGDYYRVASVGLTSGAQWNTIGAIVNGESAPVIGRLFKCLAIGPAVAGGGECYDVEFTDEVSATITNFPSFPATQAVTGTVSLTDPTTVRIRDTYGDPIVTTAGNLMVGIGNIYTANPLHTIVDSGVVSLDPTGNTVKINPTASVASRIQGLGNTAVLVSTGGLIYGASLINRSSTVNCWVKFYIKATAPTASDSPFLIQNLEFVAQYNLNSHNDAWYNMPVGTKLWVRATLTATDADTNDTGVDAEATIFLGT